MNSANILLITADDLEGTTPGAFGGPAGVTPALDRLAAEGTVFHRAHVAVAVCQPSRSAIMTGQWPHRNGAEGFQPIRDDVPLLTNLLARAGYAVGILGKVNHLQPVDRFGWDTIVDMRDLGLGRDPARYAEEAAAFFVRAADRPWFLMVNAHDPHRPFHGSADVERRFGAASAGIPEPSRVFDADDAEPPGYLPDLPTVRDEYAQYLSSARRCDDVVAAVLDRLDAAGLAESTLVVFLSDNGMAFPFSKANCYLQSTQTPLIVRWPGEVAAGGQETGSFVSMLDLFPTFCEVAGVQVGETDGESLVPLLRGEAVPAREYAVTVFHETAMKRRYEMRCVQDDRFGYIWNGWADGSTTYQAENMSGLSWPAMQEAAATDRAVSARVEFYQHRAVEELYDLIADPNSLTNLAGEPQHGMRLDAMRAVLRDWMIRTADPQLERYGALVEGPRR
ncbi:N-sulfoglucosamine sulfohydrolase [Kribbella sp. VKM Ac-2569]|uniref:sulfatase family protein n=1 Tax=Kribbella sp. VKM Ac-2569 TaxID=2512220 RepID=UPI00102D2214|nr:sulfatase [Kribbella sp. VKM Ac-2569]RZT27509.1 N-sulfoglucosamine sulfohydrolase [Kribbella sp. VKM Ac-2569]